MQKNDLNIQCDTTTSLGSTVVIKGAGSVVIGANCDIEDHVLLDTGFCGSIRISPRSKLKYGTVIRAYDGFVDIGSRVTIGEYTILAGHGGISINDTVVVAGHCYITAQNHIFSSEIPVRFQGETSKGIQIGFGSWIGGRCVVLDGVNIGEGCVVGAGSIVTKSLRQNMICYGNPCREVRSRLNET